MTRLFYYCGTNAHPTGGNKVVYRHVDLLAQAGIEAWVFHPRDHFFYEGLVSRPRVVGPSSLVLHRSDLLILPEDAGPAMGTFAAGVRKLIFNQNAYYSFRYFGLQPAALPPYRNAEIIGALVVSEDSRRYLSYAFPGLICERVVLSLDYRAFNFVPWHRKRRQIAYMTRKNEGDVAQVVKILTARGGLDDWNLVPIEGLSEPDVARVMGESQLFLAFGHPEGLSLSNLEALASGCRVIGYTGRAGREYFAATGSIEIELGDIVGFCEAVEKFVSEAGSASEEHARIAAQASHFVRTTYSQERERSSLLAAISRFLTDDQASP